MHGRVKGLARRGLQHLSAVKAHLRAVAGQAPRFSGVFATREEALSAIPRGLSIGYDNSEVVDISFEWMSRRQAFDYPIIYWLQRLLPEGGTILDAGGHLGTKYIAFADVMDLTKLKWVVFDLPNIIDAARARQQAGDLPSAVVFTADVSETAKADVMIASGFLQYYPGTLAEFVVSLPSAPKYILVNKLPLRGDTPLYTIERIGPVGVPYQMRSVAQWDTEITSAGYRVVDRWDIAGLSHVIATHPHCGPSDSFGFLLERVNQDDESKTCCHGFD